MPGEFSSLFDQLRRQSLRQLVGLVTDDRPAAEREAEALALVEQFWQLSAAEQAAAGSSQPEEEIDRRYERLRTLIEKITLYLTDIDRPAERREIVDEVSRRGFPLVEQAKARSDLKKSLTMHLQGQASDKCKLKEINSLVGLPAWPDARFERGVENVQPAGSH